MSSDGSDGSVTVGAPASAPRQFAQGLGLFDAITVVVGVMIGSGIFIVSADMARLVGSAGWLLVAWAIAGLLTIAGALSYGELSALMPRAGGMYIYLREAFSPLLGFLYGWTLFTVIQTGTIAAVSVAFARFLGVLWPAISEDRYLIPPQLISQRYAVSLSSSQLLALAIISQVGGQGLMAVALGTLPATFSALVIFLEAIAAASFGWLLLNEPLGLWQALGGVLAERVNPGCPLRAGPARLGSRHRAGCDTDGRARVALVAYPLPRRDAP